MKKENTAITLVIPIGTEGFEYSTILEFIQQHKIRERRALSEEKVATINRVLQVVSEELKMEKSILQSQSRKRYYVMFRNIFISLVREKISMSDKIMGYIIGRDRTTVLHLMDKSIPSCETITEYRQLKRKVEKRLLEEKLYKEEQIEDEEEMEETPEVQEEKLDLERQLSIKKIQEQRVSFQGLALYIGNKDLFDTIESYLKIKFPKEYKLEEESKLLADTG